jgi:hypothetical protein
MIVSLLITEFFEVRKSTGLARRRSGVGEN